MNWYNYAGGDPLNGSDPTGLANATHCSDGAVIQGNSGCAGDGQVTEYEVIASRDHDFGSFYVPDMDDFPVNRGLQFYQPQNMLYDGRFDRVTAAMPLAGARDWWKLSKPLCEKIKFVGDQFLEAGKQGTSAAVDVQSVIIVGVPFTDGASLGGESVVEGLMGSSELNTLIGDFINSVATGNYKPMIYNQFTNTAKGVLHSTTVKLTGDLIGRPLDESILGPSPYSC